MQPNIDLIPSKTGSLILPCLGGFIRKVDIE